ncbi:MAG: hypothetical protein LBJ01_10835 [Tannerella sp.]|jgi:hypothetical protein|nr:hypothetical protein [Tannerella sp.]
MVKGIDKLSVENIRREVEQGARFVYFTYNIAIVLTTLRRTSDVYFLRPGEHAFRYGWRYFLMNFFLGWWEIPGGPIYTVGSLYTAFKGKDITQDVMQEFDIQVPPDNTPPITTWAHFNQENK